jgi:hypothetical protein
MRQEYPFDVGWEQSETLECGPVETTNPSESEERHCSAPGALFSDACECCCNIFSQTANLNKAPGAEQCRSSLSDGFVVFVEIT